MVSGPAGFALVVVIVGTAALVTLLLATLWPRSSDAPERAAGRMLAVWRRFTGFDDAAADRTRDD